MGGFGRIESDYILLQIGFAWAYEISDQFSICIQPTFDYATLELMPNPTANPTHSPTESPTKTPTKAPTQHPCTSGAHGCDKGIGGVCYRADTDLGWRCDCAVGFQCISGCGEDATGHTCEMTPSPTHNPTGTPTTSPTEHPTGTPTESPTHSPTESPTAFPTGTPTGTPTEAPTDSPTQAPTGTPTTATPTAHACQSGTHGCDKGDGGICVEDPDVPSAWRCTCADGFKCLYGCSLRNPVNHRCLL